MDRVLFDLGIFQIKWYSFFILIALIVGGILFYKESSKKGLSNDDIIDIIFYGVLIGIIGARIYYVIFNLDYYLKSPLEILMIWNGGLAIHGGLIATLLFLIFYSKNKKINILLLLDIMVVSVIIAQSIGRWGNFFNREAFGRIISLSKLESMHLPKFIINGMYINGSYREPTFLYESILNLIGFIIMLIVRKIKNIKTGTITSIYLIWYGLVRVIIESFRADSLMVGNLKIAQLVSIIFIISGIVLLFRIKKNKRYIEDKL